MTTINSQTLLKFLRDYFSSIGLNAEANNFFTAKRFSQGLVLKLPMVSIVRENRPKGTRGNQTHIHVTGDNRYFFFKPKDIDGATGSTSDVKKKVVVSAQNIRALKGLSVDSTSLDCRETHTMTKLGHGANKQVQLSKIRGDGKDFIELRKGLHENDLMIFLKYHHNNALFVVGVPESFYKDDYKITSCVFSRLESKDAIPVKNALNSIVDNYEDTALIDNNDGIVDTIYQEMVDNAEASNTIYEPVKYVPTKSNGAGSQSKRPPTNPSIGKEAIKDAHYCCSVDKNHSTFIKKNGEQYMEVHHLIPLEQQENFKYKLDTKANLIPMCPLCHKHIHYGRIQDVEPIIKKLYQEREDVLKQSGLEITFEELINFYK